MPIVWEKFTTGQVLKASGLSNPALQSWINRDVIGAHDGVKPTMPGRAGIRRTFSFYTVMEISVAAALTRHGMSVEQAFKSAIVFAHTGDGRPPSFPYPDPPGQLPSTTYLVVSNGRSEVLRWQWGENALPGFFLSQAPGTPLTLLNLNQIFETVVMALGHIPDAVLRSTLHEKKGAGKLRPFDPEPKPWQPK